MESKKYLLALAIKYKGDWEQIYSAISKREDLDEKYVEELAQEYKGRFITMLDDEYPENLKQSFKPPFVLFYKGNIELLKATNCKRLALNDSRHVGKKDEMIANKIMSNLPQNTVFVIGGNSKFSCDVVESKNKPSIVVLSHSIDLFKDKEFKFHILKTGGLFISEYPDDTPKTQINIMKRYRIMASLCDKVLILSSIKRKSGTQIFIMLAMQQNKDIMVVPTSPLEDEEYINNELINEGAISIYNNETLCFNMS